MLITLRKRGAKEKGGTREGRAKREREREGKVRKWRKKREGRRASI